MENVLLQCYNKGCGQKFKATENNEKSCCHHPGEPFFHDAYKGWSCCNKKCIDFTEFLNIKGCTVAKHSNIKPVEPEKPVKNIDVDEVIEVKPIVPILRERPSFESPLTVLTPNIAASLQQQLLTHTNLDDLKQKSNEVTVGTTCKNGGCGVTYEGAQTNESTCTYHPGVPIFHEGLKFWSCCQKRTTDFNAFLNQVGCNQGKHVWIKENDGKKIQCRWDYHQTGTHVVVSIYAKQYCVHSSTIELNPIRLKVTLKFPQQDASFDVDWELKGVVDVANTQLNMFGTKVEIKLKKADPGSWSRLEIPKTQDKPTNMTTEITSKIDAVDLDDL